MSRNLVTYGAYFFNFYNKLNENVQEKIDWVFELVKTVDQIPLKYFRHIENGDGLFEIRIEAEGNIYRIFTFFDKGNLVVLINAFQKKTQKTPAAAIEFAKKLKRQYFIDKELDDDTGKRKKVSK